MLMLLRSDILANKSSSLKIFFELFDPIRTFFSLDLGQLVEPNVCHFSCENEPWVTISVAVSVFFGLSNQTNIFGADDPSLNTLAPGDLDVLSIGL